MAAAKQAKQAAGKRDADASDDTVNREMKAFDILSQIRQFKKMELIISDPRTLVIALGASEADVVVRALDALDKFAAACLKCELLLLPACSMRAVQIFDIFSIQMNLN